MYNMRKTSELLGIPAITLRAWENRYGIVSPQRTEGGHRMYSQSDIETLRKVIGLMERQGLSIGEAVRILQAERDPLSAHTDSPPTAHSPFARHKEGGTDHADHRLLEATSDRLYRELTSLQGGRANESIDVLLSVNHYEQVFYEVFIPILIRIGDEWETGVISVAQEHFASQLLVQRIMYFFRLLPVDPRLPKAVALCPEGEHHHIGLMLFTLFLRKKGIDVIYLGPHTPLSSLLPLLQANGVGIAAVSITDPSHADKLADWIRECMTSMPELRFALGGKGWAACDPDISALVLSPDSRDWEQWYRWTIGPHYM